MAGCTVLLPGLLKLSNHLFTLTMECASDTESDSGASTHNTSSLADIRGYMSQEKSAQLVDTLHPEIPAVRRAIQFLDEKMTGNEFEASSGLHSPTAMLKTFRLGYEWPRRNTDVVRASHSLSGEHINLSEKQHRGWRRCCDFL